MRFTIFRWKMSAHQKNSKDQSREFEEKFYDFTGTPEGNL